MQCVRSGGVSGSGGGEREGNDRAGEITVRKKGGVDNMHL